MIDKTLLENNHRTMYITHGDFDAPSIQNSYGSLVALLNKVLCEGFNHLIPSSIEIENNCVLKVFLPTNHSYLKNQVVNITGCLQEECNGNFRIKEVFQNYIKVNLKTVVNFTEVSTTSSFKIKVAPLGYTRVYNSTDSLTMCFKNSSKKSPVILKVIDKIPPNGYLTTWSKYARVVIGTEIDSKGDFIDNKKSPYLSDYPDAENTGNKVSGASGIHGYAKWDYATFHTQYANENGSPSNTFPRKWTIVGDSLSFYLIIDSQGSGYPTILGFGNFESYNKTESYNSFLQARGSFNNTNSNYDAGYSRSLNYFGAIGANTQIRMSGNFLLANAYGSFSNDLKYRTGGLYFSSTSAEYPHRNAILKNSNPQAGTLITSKLFIIDEDTGIVRGNHRGIKCFYGIPQVSLNKITEEGLIVLEFNDSGNSQVNAPYLFSLLDWDV